MLKKRCAMFPPPHSALKQRLRLLVIHRIHTGKRLEMESGGDSRWRKRGNALQPPQQRAPVVTSKATTSSAAQALDAYLAKYQPHLQPSGQQRNHRHKARGDGFNLISTTGRQSPLQDSLAVLPLGTTAQIQPKSPLSRFKQQAARIAWKRNASPHEAAGDDDTDNVDSSNAVLNPHGPPLTVEDTQYVEHCAIDRKENRPLGNRREAGCSSHLLMTSVTGQALLDKVREAKRLGGQPKKTSALKHGLHVESDRQQTSLGQRAQRLSLIADASEMQETGVTMSAATGRAPDSRLNDCSHVKIASVAPSPAPITRRSELGIKRMAPSKHSPHTALPSSPGTRRETQQPKKPGGIPPSLSVEVIVRVSNAAVAIQRAWRSRRERELRQASFLLQGTLPSDPDRQPSSDEVDSAVDEQSGPLEVACGLPRPPQSVWTCVATAEAKQTDEASSDDDSPYTAPVPDSDGFAEVTTHTEAAAVVPVQVLWVDDDWLCLEEGKYEGDLKAGLGSQSALSSIKSNAESLLVRRHPQQLIQRRESERVAWLQQFKRRKVTLARRAQNDFELCEELQIDAASSSEAQTAESEDVGLRVATEAVECASLGIESRRTTYLVPLLRYGRKRCGAPTKIRVLRRSTRRGGEQRESSSQANAGLEDVSARHLQSCGSVDAEEEQKERCDVSLAVSSFGIFSSFANEHHRIPRIDDQRNDLISIGVDETERGGSQSSTAISGSCKSDGCSRIEPGRMSQVESSGFIPLSFAARDAPASAELSSLAMTEANTQVDGEKKGNDTVRFVQLVRELRAPSIDGSEARHDEEPAREELDNNGQDQLGNDVASVTVERLWQQRFDTESYGPQFGNAANESTELVSLHGTAAVHVDAAKKEEFRRILDEFRESLRQSSSSSQHSYSDSLSESCCSNRQRTKSELPSLLVEAKPMETSAISRDEAEEEDDDEAVDEELQAMLHEINHSKQQFQHTADSKVAQ